MGALYARVGGVWVPVAGTADEVYVGTDDPGPTYELWVDTDAAAPAPGVGIPSGGTAGQALIKQSATDYAASWQTPIGAELLYSQITANVSVTATTAASAQTLINPGNINYDGTPIMIEFNGPGMTPPNVANGQLAVSLWDANTDMGSMAMVYAPSALSFQVPVYQVRRITPTPGLHNYNLRAWISPSGTGTVVAGPGTTTYAPAFLRVTKIS